MVRFTYLPVVTVLVGSFGFAAPAVAQETSQPAALVRDGVVTVAEPPVGTSRPDARLDLVAAPTRERRPAPLLPLYISLGALQVLDVHSTHRALAGGAVEANPLMKGLASHEIGLMSVKAAAAAGVIYASERIWTRNKAAAVVFMVATNSAMAWVVQHNYQAVR